MKYRELIREVIAAITEGKVSPSLIAELREMEEALSKDLPPGLEGRAYLRASEILRNLRLELENSSKLLDLFMKAAYGADISRAFERAQEKEVEGRKSEFKPLNEGMKLTLVTFKTHVPRFVGVDMRVYGPFSEGDLALIPEENAEALRSKGAVEVIDGASPGFDQDLLS